MVSQSSGIIWKKSRDIFGVFLQEFLGGSLRGGFAERFWSFADLFTGQ